MFFEFDRSHFGTMVVADRCGNSSVSTIYVLRLGKAAPFGWRVIKAMFEYRKASPGSSVAVAKTSPSCNSEIVLEYYEVWWWGASIIKDSRKGLKQSSYVVINDYEELMSYPDTRRTHQQLSESARRRRTLETFGNGPWAHVASFFQLFFSSHFCVGDHLFGPPCSLD